MREWERAPDQKRSALMRQIRKSRLWGSPSGTNTPQEDAAMETVAASYR